MKLFSKYIAEKIIASVALPKRSKAMTAAEKKKQAQNSDKIKSEFAWRTHIPVGYVDLGHNSSARGLEAIGQKVWGVNSNLDTQTLPLLWWWNGQKIVVWEIKHRNDTHEDIPQYRKDAKDACNGVENCTEIPLYQGRVDRIRRVISLISAAGTRNSIMFDRSLERNKRRIDTALRKQFPGYTIHDMDSTYTKDFDIRGFAQ